MLPTKQEFNDMVQEILKRKEYRNFKNYIYNLIEDVKERITDWLINRLDSIEINLPETTLNNLSLILISAASLIFIVIIIIIILKINGSFEKTKEIRRIHGEKIDKNTTPQSLREKAADWKRKRKFRQAVRFDFIALLLMMHEKGIFYLQKSQTNEEIYQKLKENNFPVLSLFKRLSFSFNQYWYGHKSCDSASYQNWQSDYELFWNEVAEYEV